MAEWVSRRYKRGDYKRAEGRKTDEGARCKWAGAFQQENNHIKLIQRLGLFKFNENSAEASHCHCLVRDNLVCIGHIKHCL